MRSEEKVDLDDCHNNDTIWGLAVKMAFELVDNHVRQKDHVLHHLIRIGIHDWASFDVRGPEGIWSMTYAAVIRNRLFKLLEEESTKVRCWI